MKVKIAVLVGIFGIVGLSFALAPFIERPDMNKMAGCCSIKDETGEGLKAPVVAKTVGENNRF
ncbi:MAG: hypothetical protein ACRCYY_05015 [Trueperaceae bacterium]